jgi:hypothetical protein
MWAEGSRDMAGLDQQDLISQALEMSRHYHRARAELGKGLGRKKKEAT